MNGHVEARDGFKQDLSINTQLLHADDGIESLSDVSPAIHLSTTYNYTENNEPRDAIYSRENFPTVRRCEAVLAKILRAPAVVYSSGLSAAHAILIQCRPKRLFIEKAQKGGYHGSLGVAELYGRCSGMEIHTLEELDASKFKLSREDMIWLESPLNPTGEAVNIAKYVSMKQDATIVVDATFAPPPLQEPLSCGVDWVLHSATKYLGGHSDLLAGVLAGHDSEAMAQLMHDRTYLGTIPGGHTAWLLLRSLRTFEMRVQRQAASALYIAQHLAALVSDTGGLYKVTHSSLQEDEFVAKQMTGGHSPTFAIYFHTEHEAAAFPQKLKYFHHATSLGGVESLVEWRALSDKHCDKRLVRISIGIENQEDLWLDLQQGIKAIAAR